MTWVSFQKYSGITLPSIQTRILHVNVVDLCRYESARDKNAGAIFCRFTARKKKSFCSISAPSAVLNLICHSHPELECSIMAYFYHHHDIMAQNSLCPPPPQSRFKLGKIWVQTEHFNHHGWDFFQAAHPPLQRGWKWL